jgi:lipid II:glycine glycyltransferase (peptidoglycan interpeptide bridge formation enzyme)
MIRLGAISAERYLEFVQARGEASFLQLPAWARVKPDWGSELVAWRDGETVVGVGLVLTRRIPKLRRFLAYLPEGPVLDWALLDPGIYLDPLVQYLKKRGAFAVRIGPTQVVRRWGAGSVKNAIADDAVTSLSLLTPDQEEPAGLQLQQWLRQAGWCRQMSVHSFGAGQPPFNFQLPLQGKSQAELLAGMNQLWRRNIKKSDAAGVHVRLGGAADLAGFHRLYTETAGRDGFMPRPLGYFETMWQALRAEDPDCLRLYLAEHESDLVAAATWVKVGRHVWYSYGASSSVKRDVRGSNAIQWRMIRDALEAGASVYDLRGITGGLSAGDPEIGLIRFKAGLGGEAIEYVGEWDLPINRLLYRAFLLYLNRGGRRGSAGRAAPESGSESARDGQVSVDPEENANSGLACALADNQQGSIGAAGVTP